MFEWKLNVISAHMDKAIAFQKNKTTVDHVKESLDTYRSWFLYDWTNKLIKNVKQTQKELDM